MGKALLIIVLGAGLALTQQLYTAFVNESATGEDQVEYQQSLIAREIANSAFNLGMGVVRSYGDNVQRGSRELNGSLNEGRSGTFASGRFAGGRYEVRSEMLTGHSVRVVATGYFGKQVDPQTGEETWAAEHVMHDEYRVPVLIARTDGPINVSFLESQAGYCSAVFYQAYTTDMPEGFVPKPVMLFASDNRDRRTARPSQQIFVEAGTQMNFFIGVDQNCSTRLPASTPECKVRKHAQDYTFNAGDFDYVHSALTVEAGKLDQAEESIWGITEQNPNSRQRWRVAWEDIHETSWDAVTSKDPTKSLQALKSLGYDGTGWNVADTKGYRLLKDFGSRPDFSDQVIEIEVISPQDPRFQSSQQTEREAREACGEPTAEIIEPEPTPSEEPSSPEEPTTPADPGSENPGSEGPGSETGSEGGTTSGESTESTGDPMTDYACKCTKNNTNKKTPILHRPPGNESNEQLLCLPETAIEAHRAQHNDIFPTCSVRREIQDRKKK